MLHDLSNIYYLEIQKYSFDYFIQISQIIAATGSLWVPFNDDMFVNRIGITLAILLTLT